MINYETALLIAQWSNGALTADNVMNMVQYGTTNAQDMNPSSDGYANTTSNNSTDLAQLKKDEARYDEQLKCLETLTKEIQDNLFNVKAKLKEVSNG